MVLDRVGLTGASGMLGRHIIELLESAGVSVAASSRQKPASLQPQSSWTSWDLRDWKQAPELDLIFADCNALIHAGALVPGISQTADKRALFEANVRACACISQWAISKNIPLLYISGATVYKDPFAVQIPETAAIGSCPIGGAYGRSKLLAEQVFDFYITLGLKLCVLRPSSLYGAGQQADKLIPRFIEIAQNNRVIELAAPVDDRVNLVHASDLARAVLCALQRETWQTFNIASKKSYSISEIAQTVVEVIGRGRVNYSPPANLQEPQTRFDLDYSSARNLLEFDAEVDLTDGINRLARDYCF